MSELARERFYFSIALIVLMLSPLTAWAASTAQGWGFTKFELGWTILTPLAMTLVVILIDIFISVLRYRTLRGRVWVEKPTTASKRNSAFDGVSELAVARGRLRMLGFKVGEQADNRIEYRKEKIKEDESFLAHEFTGYLEWAPREGGCSLRNSVTMHDTLIVETHERAAIQSLSDFIVGTNPKHEMKVVPMSALSALLHAVLISAAVWMRFRNVGFYEGEILGTAPVAAVFNLYAVFVIWSNRDKYFGLRISLVGLGLTLVPVVGYLVLPLVGWVSGR